MILNFSSIGQRIQYTEKNVRLNYNRNFVYIGDVRTIASAVCYSSDVYAYKPNYTLRSRLPFGYGRFYLEYPNNYIEGFWIYTSEKDFKLDSTKYSTKYINGTTKTDYFVTESNFGLIDKKNVSAMDKSFADLFKESGVANYLEIAIGALRYLNELKTQKIYYKILTN